MSELGCQVNAGLGGPRNRAHRGGRGLHGPAATTGWEGGIYVAAPNLVLQSGPLALIISVNATSVARRNLDGWHYVISRLDL